MGRLRLERALPLKHTCLGRDAVATQAMRTWAFYRQDHSLRKEGRVEGVHRSWFLNSMRVDLAHLAASEPRQAGAGDGWKERCWVFSPSLD